MIEKSNEVGDGTRCENDRVGEEGEEEVAGEGKKPGGEKEETKTNIYYKMQ